MIYIYLHVIYLTHCSVMEGGASNPGPLAPRSICPEVVCEKDHGSLDLSPGYDKGLAAASNATFDSVRMFV
jgi:hypothetical protein